MTTGQQLKERLHLKNFPQARICRLVTGGSLKIYQILFNSRHPDLPMTTYQLRVNPLTPKVTGGNGTKFYATPWANLDVFNGSLAGAIFFSADVAGNYGYKDNYSEKIFSFTNNKLEEITIPDLRNVDQYTSSTTQKYKDIRKDFQGQGIKNTKLMDSQYIESTGSLRFIFLTESTETKNKKSVDHSVAGEKKKQFDVGTDKLVDNPSKTYDMYLQLENVFPNSSYDGISWLETYNGEEVDEKMMKELLDVADVKLFSNDPSFQYQGFAYRLTQLDASINKEDRPDTFWRSKHGNQGLLSKHFSQLLDSGTITVLLNNMTSMLIKQSKKLGYAKNIGKDNKLVISIGDSK